MITTTTRGGTVALADAPQRGRSDSAPMPRDPGDVVTELYDLLAAADVPGPYVMVGHSLGGTLSVLYARTYPDEVRALVVVDSPLPPLRGLIGAEPGYELESYDTGELLDQIEAANPLPDIPVIVVRRGEVRMSEDPLPEGAALSQAEVSAINEAQREAQVLWAEGVPGAEVITVPDTTHYVQNQRPDVVTAAIRDGVSLIKFGKGWCRRAGRP
jgi:pimeloyl-ACP methyl ester carboxylesterase